MATYLLQWNPNIDRWPTLADDVEEIRQRGFLDGRWSCGVTKRIEQGDRVFMLRTGVPPKGIVASGVVTREPYEDTHFARPRDTALYIRVRYDTLLHAGRDKILSMDKLDSPELAGSPWHIQGSGKTIPPKPAAALERIWSAFLAANGRSPVSLAEEISDPSLYFEGATRKISVNSYERSAEARQLCIEHHGCCCAVCGFDFEKVFGELGHGFIHVHHLKPLSEIRAEYRIDPIEDLRPVCPNCHAIIHRGAEMMILEDLRERIRRK